MAGHFFFDCGGSIVVRGVICPHRVINTMLILLHNMDYMN